MIASIAPVLSVATTFVSDILTGLVVAQATVAVRGSDPGAPSYWLGALVRTPRTLASARTHAPS